MTGPPRYVPARGDLVWVQLNPRTGHEQGGHRPVLVLSPAGYNGRVGMAVVCPVTSRAKGYPFEVPLPAGLTTVGVVLADHVRTVDWVARSAAFIEAVPPAVVDDVVQALDRLLR